MKFRFLMFLFVLFQINKTSFSQVFINEILVDADGANDGSNMPNTAEWIELYNAGATAVDISCWVLADGDMTITIPSPNSIPAGGFFTLASFAGSGLTPNLNFGTCGCGTPASEIVVFTNGGEQLALTNAAGTIIDGVTWGAASPGGQALPDATNATIAVGVCPVRNISLPAATNAVWEYIGNQAAASTAVDGVTAERSYDGSPTWQSGGFGGTFGTTNGPAPLPIELTSFTAEVVSETESEINWQTASEINSNYYTVLKSKDGFNYTEVSRVPSYNASTGANYKIYDTNFDFGITYYKLINTDFDGSIKKHAPIYIENSLAKQNVNITYGVTNTKIKFINTNAILESQIIDGSGRVVKQLTKTDIANGFLSFNSDILTVGIYFIKINYKNENTTHKFIVR